MRKHKIDLNIQKCVINVTVVMLVGLSFVACSEQKTHMPTRIHSVLVTTVKNTSINYDRAFTGTIRPRYESQVGFRTDGKIIMRLVDVGQVVMAGQLLARIDKEDYELAVRVAENMLQAARVDAEQSASDESRYFLLLSNHAISTVEYERQKARADIAAARLSQALNQLDLARNKNKYTSLVAEFGGLVTSVRFEPGQMVNAGEAILSIAKQTDMEVVVNLPNEMAGQINTFIASAAIWNKPNLMIPLELRELSPEADEKTHMYRARFSLLKPRAEVLQFLRLGMVITLQLSAKNRGQGAVIPASAILNVDDQAFVWMVNDSGRYLERRPVDVLRYSSDAVLVRGLSDGIKVVSAGVQKLTPNMEVVAVERSAIGLDVSISPASQISPNFGVDSETH